jgi:hypothetical protein
VEAVRVKRTQLAIANPESRAWTPEEMSQLGTATHAKFPERIGSTTSAVSQNRIALGTPPAC